MQSRLATEAVIRRAIFYNDDSAPNEESDDLNRISNRLELRGLCCAEPHVTDDNSGKRVDNPVGNSSVLLSVGGLSHERLLLTLQKRT